MRSIPSRGAGKEEIGSGKIGGLVRNGKKQKTEKKENERRLKDLERQKDDILPVYDTSINPPFDEGRYNRIMEERKKKKEEVK